MESDETEKWPALLFSKNVSMDLCILSINWGGANLLQTFLPSRAGQHLNSDDP